MRPIAVVLLGCLLVDLTPRSALATHVDASVTPDAYANADQRIRLKGDRHLNLRCSGKGHPVVLLEAGGNADSSTWFRVHPVLAGLTRVCAYDRAGYGFSDEGPMPRSIDADVADLHALMEAAGLARPVLLVGHSLGSNIVRRYAEKHPQDVVGLVLVDPPEQGPDDLMPPDWRAQIKAQEAHRAAFLDTCEQAAEAADAATLKGSCLRAPPSWMSAATGAAMTRNKSTPAYWRTLRSALANNAEVFSTPVPDGESYGALPLILLRATRQDEAPPEVQKVIAATRAQTHARILAASSRSQQIDVADASHDIQLDQPHAVVDAVRELLAEVSQ